MESELRDALRIKLDRLRVLIDAAEMRSRELHRRYEELEDASREALTVLIYISAMNSDIGPWDFAVEKLQKARVTLNN